MSVYSGTGLDEFSSCLESVFAQSLPPSQIVLVMDGPVNVDVKAHIEVLQRQQNVPVDVLTFRENRGLGAALADGLAACRNQYIARVDTDDISVPERFFLQHNYLSSRPELTAVGGLLEEVYQEGDEHLRMVRQIPLRAEDISASARFRNPINHPTVMFRRDHVLEVGGYQPFLWFEDYLLWARLIVNERLLENMQKVLVSTVADTGYFDRRGGLNYLKQEIKLTAAFRKIGFHNAWQSIFFIATRSLTRLIPLKLRRLVYKKLLRSQSDITQSV